MIEESLVGYFLHRYANMDEVWFVPEKGGVFGELVVMALVGRGITSPERVRLKQKPNQGLLKRASASFRDYLDFRQALSGRRVWIHEGRLLTEEDVDSILDREPELAHTILHVDSKENFFVAHGGSVAAN